MRERIQLSDHFSFGRLIRFTIPTIGMMIFTSLYGVVDGLFVSNFAGKTSFASINFVWPVISVLSVVGFMVGAGGNAIVSRLLGQKNERKALEVFSMLLYLTIGVGVILSVLGLLFLRPLLLWMGASEEMMGPCMVYGRILLFALPASLLQFEFHTFLVTAEKPELGLRFTLAAGISNMLLDALFIGFFHWGVAGAALATIAGQCIGGFGPLVYFASKNSSLLRLVGFRFDGKALLETCVNGSSELLSSISMSLVSMLYNIQLMKYIGENGVAAYGVIMYVNFIFISWFVGYSVGAAPLVGFNYGASNRAELKNLFGKSMTLITIFGVLMAGAAELLARPLSGVFVGYDPSLHSLTIHAFRICSLSFLVSGFNIFASSLFTALGNGLISAAIAFFRTLVCEVAAILLLPRIIGIEGIWLAVLVAEGVAIMLSGVCILKFRNRYGYC